MLAPFYLVVASSWIFAFAICKAAEFQFIPIDVVDAVMISAVFLFRSHIIKSYFRFFSWPFRVAEALIAIYYTIIPPIYISYAVQKLSRQITTPSLSCRRADERPLSGRADSCPHDRVGSDAEWPPGVVSRRSAFGL